MIDKPFIPGWSIDGYGLRPFAPELWLIGAIVAVLITPFFTRKSNAICGIMALAGLALALISALVVGVDDQVVGSHFRGMLVGDHLAVMWKVLLLIFAIGIVLMWFSVTSATMHEGDGPEFFTLLLGATLGMSLMGSTANLLMIVMCVELASLPSYVLAGFRKTHRPGAEASVKYVLFGAASSAIMIYGLSVFYGLFGTLEVDQIAAQIGRGSTASAALLSVAVAGLVIGPGFKISAVPFHFWCPDVFEGAGIDVSAFLSVASKGAGLVLLLRVLMTIADATGYQNTSGLSLGAIAVVIGVIGSITATVGNTAAFVQTNIKRLLAYSSIAHAGYMLCVLSLLVRHNQAAGEMADIAAQAILLYLAVYLFMNLGAFTAAGMIWRETGSENIDDYEGMNRRSPLLAACMTAFMFSLVGLPPFAGFAAKLNVMYVLGANGGWWWTLVVVIGVNTIFSLYYYARVVKVMYLKPSDRSAVAISPLGASITVLCAAMLVLMLLGWGLMQQITTSYGRVHTGSRAGAVVAVTPDRQP